MNTFQIATRPSEPVDTIYFPSGENFKLKIALECVLQSTKNYPDSKS